MLPDAKDRRAIFFEKLYILKKKKKKILKFESRTIKGSKGSLIPMGDLHRVPYYS